MSDTEKQRLKIQSIVQTLKNTILKRKTKNFRNIYEVWFKNKASLFFLPVYSEMKMKIREQQTTLKENKRKNKTRKKFFLIKKIVKIFENENES